jgi:uncharacterized protein
MIVDANANVGEGLYGPRQSFEELVVRMDEVGIDVAVVSPLTPADLDYRKANRWVADRVAKDDRFVGFARIDPRFGRRSFDELDACVRDGLSGVKVDPFEQAFQINSTLVFEFFRRCAEAGLPVIVVAGYPVLSTPIQVGDLAERLTGLKLLMSHGGQLAMHGLGILDCLEVLREAPNVWIETSGIPETGTESLIERAVLEVAAERVVFGTDSPNHDADMELERIRVARIPEVAKTKILGPNLLGILAREGGSQWHGSSR